MPAILAVAPLASSAATSTRPRKTFPREVRAVTWPPCCSRPPKGLALPEGYAGRDGLFGQEGVQSTSLRHVGEGFR